MDRQLSGVQRKDLWEALLAAFPDHDALEAMVSFQLNQNLDAVAGGINLSGIVLNLIQWAEAENRVSDLVAGARAANPGNPALEAFATRWAAAPPAPAGGGPRVTGVPGRALSPALIALGAIPILLIAAWLVLMPPGRLPAPGGRATVTVQGQNPVAPTSTPVPVPSATPAPVLTTTPALPATAPPGPVAAACTGAQLCFNAGNQYLASGDWHRAIVEFNRAIAADPAFADAYDSLGYAYDRTGDYDRAVQLYAQAIALDGQNPLFYYNRGSTYYREAQVRDQGNPSRQTLDYQAVLADMTRALDLQLTGQTPYAYFFRGSAYGATGDAGHARADLGKARDLCGAVDPGLCKEVDAALQALPNP